MGIARISPIAPHIQPQNRSEIVSARAFKRTRQPTRAGISRLAVTIWKKRQHRKDADEGPDGVVLLQSDQQRRNPRHNDAEVGDQIANAGNQAGEEREVEPEAPRRKASWR